MGATHLFSPVIWLKWGLPHPWSFFRLFDWNGRLPISLTFLHLFYWDGGYPIPRCFIVFFIIFRLKTLRNAKRDRQKCQSPKFQCEKQFALLFPLSCSLERKKRDRTSLISLLVHCYLVVGIVIIPQYMHCASFLRVFLHFFYQYLFSSSLGLFLLSILRWSQRICPHFRMASFFCSYTVKLS